MDRCKDMDRSPQVRIFTLGKRTFVMQLKHMKMGSCTPPAQRLSNLLHKGNGFPDWVFRFSLIGFKNLQPALPQRMRPFGADSLPYKASRQQQKSPRTTHTLRAAAAWYFAYSSVMRSPSVSAAGFGSGLRACNHQGVRGGFQWA
eukprot:1155879-Pelagomonas_calceolata.AAC.8